MEDNNFILGIFYSDENNLVYENIEFSENLSEENKSQLRMIPFKFLGPIFLTASDKVSENWKINFIESTLSLYQESPIKTSVIQSFFSLNSSIYFEEGITNLFILIGSPYTEDVYSIYDKIVNYIHPSIINDIIINKYEFGDKIRNDRIIKKELNRGFKLIKYSLGSSRKMYWNKQYKYYCVGLIERVNSNDLKESYLYTFKKDDSLLRKFLPFIPSFYVMAIVPDYYEKLVDETLKLFEKDNIYSNIRQINLSNENKKVIYLEEFSMNHGIKKSYGVILIAENEKNKGAKNISFYKKNLRLKLDKNKNVKEFLEIINPRFSIKKWGTNSEKELNDIHEMLDNTN